MGAGLRRAHGDQPRVDHGAARWTATLAAGDLLARLEAEGVPAGRIYRAADMLDDPHFAAREAIVSLPHPEFGQVAMQNVAPRLSATPGYVRSVGPELGAHNAEVYGDVLGLDDVALAGLRAEGII